MLSELLLLFILGPVAMACVCVLLPRRARVLPAALTQALFLALLGVLTAGFREGGTMSLALGGWAPPLGIRLYLDGAALLVLWLIAIVGTLTSIHAWFSGLDRRNSQFWILWLLLFAGINGVVLSADLFNLYVALEIVTLAAVALVALEGSPTALRAAMRYLLLGLLASLAWLLGVALTYNFTGTLDIHLAAFAFGEETRGLIALSLMSVGLMLKTAIFPLHVWLPPAHSSAPGAVSAVLSALVVKVSLLLLYRLWFWMAPAEALDAGRLLFGLAGAGAILYGSLAAFVQPRLKLMVAYSTVAQLGYLLLVFPLAGLLAWQATMYQLLAHGLAKAAMFLAAANILRLHGTDRFDALSRIDRLAPLNLFAFALAGVSIMGLPPSGGFLAKWMLLMAAWSEGGWFWLMIIMVGSLLAAAYVFRALTCALQRGGESGPETPASDPREQGMALAPLVLALLALLLGFVSAPLLSLLGEAPPLAGGAAR